MLRIGVIAGESSGDHLGAGLIRAIRRRRPDVQFEGAAGPEMQAAGCRALVHIDELSVMGLAELLVHLPRLLRLRRRLRRHFLTARPDLVVGIDAPDFNLGLESRLRKAGVHTVHYVSPSVWAWRSRRLFKVGKAAELVLTLLPFEAELYTRHGYHAVFVGHPLADRAPEEPDRAALRKQLHLPPTDPLVALLPGSRSTEVERLWPLFLDTAQWLSAERPGVRFVVPTASARLGLLIKRQIRTLKPDLPVTVVEGRAREVLGAADAGLIASGTATLEAMLWRCPMVVAYRVAASTFVLVRGLRLLHIPNVALPNILAGRQVVPEFVQYRAVPHAMGQALLELLEDENARARQLESFAALRSKLQRGADQRAAEAVLALVAGMPLPRG
ncbi:MAG: lipid-A-disaccharide synthase [Gammaproteobacteria bacterium]